MKRSQGKGDPHGPGLTVKKCSQDVEMEGLTLVLGPSTPHTHTQSPGEEA